MQILVANKRCTYIWNKCITEKKMNTQNFSIILIAQEYLCKHASHVEHLIDQFLEEWVKAAKEQSKLYNK